MREFPYTEIRLPALATERTDPRHGATTDLIVLIHGLGGNGMVHYLLREAAADEITTIMVDLSGIGRSVDRGVERFSDWVDDVRSVIPEEAERVLLVGHSLGTLVARHVAAHDERVTGLLLFAPIMAPTDETRPAFAARAGDARAHGMVHVADHFGLAGLGTDATKPDSLARLTVRNFLMNQRAEEYADASSALASAEEPASPAADEVVSVIVRGADDRIATDEITEGVTAALGIDDGVEILLPNVGHWPTIEAPAASLHAFQQAVQRTFHRDCSTKPEHHTT